MATARVAISASGQNVHMLLIPPGVALHWLDGNPATASVSERFADHLRLVREAALNQVRKLGDRTLRQHDDPVVRDIDVPCACPRKPRTVQRGRSHAGYA